MPKREADHPRVQEVRLFRRRPQRRIRGHRYGLDEADANSLRTHHTNLPRKLSLRFGERAANTSASGGLGFGPGYRACKELRQNCLEIHPRVLTVLTQSPSLGAESVCWSAGYYLKEWRRARDSNPQGPRGPVDFKSRPITKRELLEAVQAAAVPGGSPTLSGVGRQVRYVLPVGLRG